MFILFLDMICALTIMTSLLSLGGLEHDEGEIAAEKTIHNNLCVLSTRRSNSFFFRGSQDRIILLYSYLRF
uniref:Secreted protein n=1 Tax=Caenorhabditis japonica TaxID=281687 RepID=A0A8R1IJ59_CAEJA